MLLYGIYCDLVMPRVAWAHAWALELCRSTVYDMAQRHALAWHDGCWRMIIILAAATALSANASARRTGADAEPGTHALPTLMRVVAVGRHGVKNPLPADGTFEGIPVSSFFGHGALMPTKELPCVNWLLDMQPTEVLVL